MNDAPAERVVLRPVASVLAAAIASTSTFALPAMFAIPLLGQRQNDLAWVILGVACAGVFATTTVRVRCVVSAAGIEVVNLWRTRFVPWASVDRVELAQGWLGGAFFLSSFCPLRIRTIGGDKVIVQASLAEPDKVTEAIEPYLAATAWG
jgi:Bacterial PH domain